MRILHQLDEIEDLLELFDMVRASDIARRCGVDRWTVSRWKQHRDWDPDRARYHCRLPVPHLVVSGVEFWSWPLLARHDPEQFPADASREAA